MITDDKLLQAIRDIEATNRKATDCGYSWPLIKDALTELMELRKRCAWQDISTAPKPADFKHGVYATRDKELD